MYQLAYENKDIVIRFDKNSIDKMSLANILEYLEIEQIRKKSKLSENDVLRLSKKINRKVWEQLKDKYIEE